jgi:spore coat polysaccharide biosynthesis protein SpsF
MVKVVAIGQARMGSTRLPGKTMMSLMGKSLIQHVIERVKRCRRVDEIVIATTTNPEDDALERFCRSLDVSVYRGSQNDVLDRFCKASQASKADHIVRFTCDDPLIDPANFDTMIEAHIKEKADLTYTKDMPWGTGLGNCAISGKALKRSCIDSIGKEPRYREHADEYILDNPQTFKILALECDPDLKRDYRLTVDTPEDMRFMTRIYEKLYREGEIVDLKAAIRLLDSDPKMLARN